MRGRWGVYPISRAGGFSYYQYYAERIGVIFMATVTQQIEPAVKKILTSFGGARIFSVILAGNAGWSLLVVTGCGVRRFARELGYLPGETARPRGREPGNGVIQMHYSHPQPLIHPALSLLSAAL
jgi:hypothetical protein